jgi:hypothetical protein
MSSAGPIVHALFVDPNGPYPAMNGVDCWDETRDAMDFQDAGPVVSHPPCGRWCGMARLNERRWGAKVGDDGGMFGFALYILDKNGGVLEHPAFSIAFDTFNVPRPKGIGWSEIGDSYWVCEVWQSAYGHSCHKRTWLLYKGFQPPFELDWRRDKSLATHQIGGGIHTGNRAKPRLDGKLTHLTPAPLAQTLVRLARHSRVSELARVA